MVVLLLSRLCEDEAQSRIQQPLCAVVVGVFCDSLLREMGGVYSRHVLYWYQTRSSISFFFFWHVSTFCTR